MSRTDSNSLCQASQSVLIGTKSTKHTQFCQIWSNMEMSKDPAKYEVLIKQYLRSILAIISNTTKKNAVIKPLMMYGSQVWTLCNKEALERVLRMQKRAARIILEAQRSSRTVTLFNNLSWISFYNEAYIKRCELAYKRINYRFCILEGHKFISNVIVNVTCYPHKIKSLSQKLEVKTFFSISHWADLFFKNV